MNKKVRVRFAPSPTGGLHLGGVRTVLYNYLFARQHGGDFILRIEDTDQNRYVAGAEEYIYDTLEWCGLQPDESPRHGGSCGPYRQSERKQLYREYADKLVSLGVAYYAFDTTEELEAMRENLRSEENPSPQYDHRVRGTMRNSLNLPEAEVKKLMDAGTAHVVRIRMPEGETIAFQDMIRGEIRFDTSTVDDKVLLKADGMPTYHLAVVVDDHLMAITHAFRGEEWLPSAPVHIYVWRHLFGEDRMPQWAHLPLILGPSGKLSKRDGAKYGFPVFAMSWTDPRTGELTEGFRERGFLPEAFINLLALLGWNDGTEQELFTLDELSTAFRLEKVHHGGARFDYEKALWFNHEWIKRSLPARLLPDVKKLFEARGWPVEDEAKLLKIILLVKDRCPLLTDMITQSAFFFEAPAAYDTASFAPKWSAAKTGFFNALAAAYETEDDWSVTNLELIFKSVAESSGLKMGELQLPFRVMLVGGKFGPGVFDIAAVIGRNETRQRIHSALTQFDFA